MPFDGPQAQSLLRATSTTGNNIPHGSATLSPMHMSTGRWNLRYSPDIAQSKCGAMGHSWGLGGLRDPEIGYRDCSCNM